MDVYRSEVPRGVARESRGANYLAWASLLFLVHLKFWTLKRCSSRTILMERGVSYLYSFLYTWNFGILRHAPVESYL